MYYNRKYFYLDEKQLKSFNSFIKENRLTRFTMSKLDGEGRSTGSINVSFSSRKVKVTFANRVVQAWIKNQKIIIKKYRDLNFKIPLNNNQF